MRLSIFERVPEPWRLRFQITWFYCEVAVILAASLLVLSLLSPQGLCWIGRK